MKTALLVIDVQRGLFDPAPRPFEADEVVRRINALTQRARAAGVAVAFIQHERATGMLTFGSESWQLAQDLTALPEDELARKETAYRNRRSDDIEETVFQVTVRGGGYDLLVYDQTPKR